MGGSFREPVNDSDMDSGSGASADEDSACDSDDFPEAMPDAAESMPAELESAAAKVAEILAREKQEAEDACVAAGIEAEEKLVERDRDAAARADGLRAKAERELHARRSNSRANSYYDAAALQAWFAEDYAAEHWTASRCVALNRTVVRCLGDPSCACSNLDAKRLQDEPTMLCHRGSHRSIASNLRVPSVFVNQLSTAYVHLSYRRDGVITVGNYEPRLRALRERGAIHLPEARALLEVLQQLESMHGLATIRFARLVLEQLFFVPACPA